MARDIFCISPDSPRYSDTALEVSGALGILIQKIEMLLYTERGSVLGVPDFGLDLEKYVFESSVSAETLQGEIMRQLRTYVITDAEEQQFSPDVKVSFFDYAEDFSFACEVDIIINGYKYNSYFL